MNKPMDIAMNYESFLYSMSYLKNDQGLKTLNTKGFRSIFKNKWQTSIHKNGDYEYAQVTKLTSLLSYYISLVSLCAFIRQFNYLHVSTHVRYNEGWL